MTKRNYTSAERKVIKDAIREYQATLEGDASYNDISTYLNTRQIKPANCDAWTASRVGNFLRSNPVRKSKINGVENETPQHSYKNNDVIDAAKALLDLETVSPRSKELALKALLGQIL